MNKKFNKKEVLGNLLNVPKLQKRNFWAREMKILNDLMKIFPEEDFWSKLCLPSKIDSLLILNTEEGKKKLQSRYNQYKYIPKETKKIPLGKKVGKDYKIKDKPKTIKNFLK